MSATQHTIVVTVRDGVFELKLNRPAKKNAFSIEQYGEVAAAMDEAARRTDVKVLVITGSGDYYSSGNDLSQFLQVDMSSPAAVAETVQSSKTMLRNFVQKFIRFPKILVAAVNGPAIGIACTTLALADFVYASDRATFSTPFSSLGQSPEGCSSLMFPAIMGLHKANEILILGKKFTAAEAKAAGLVSEVFPESEFEQRVSEITKQLASLPSGAVQAAKKVMRAPLLEALEKANEFEVEVLGERWASAECMEAVMSFVSRPRSAKL